LANIFLRGDESFLLRLPSGLILASMSGIHFPFPEIQCGGANMESDGDKARNSSPRFAQAIQGS
jgi:hypothetical protein